MQVETLNMETAAGADHRYRWLIRLLILAVAAAGAFAVYTAFQARGAQAIDLEASGDCWSPHRDDAGICGAGSPDALTGIPVTVNANINGCGFIDGGCAGMTADFTLEADRDDNGSFESSTVTNATSGTVGIPVGTFSSPQVSEPRVRICDSPGSSCSDPDKYDWALVNIDLDIANNVPPSADMDWWDPCYEIIGCSAGAPDGIPQTYTLTAHWDDSDDNAGSDVTSVQWDFDGNGTTDATQTFGAGGATGTRTTTHYYSEGVYQPQVRFCDQGGCGGWDKKDILGINTDLDVEDNNPSTPSMDWWTPCFEVLGLCSAGSPDGLPGTYTLNADGFSDDAGVDFVEWDFDGNGTVDGTTDLPNGTGTYDNVTTTHVYAEGVYQPQVRAVDTGGQRSGWDKKDIAFINTDLDVVDADPATPSMDWWSPCYEVLGLCSGGSPDGRPSTTFTLNADGFSDDGGVDFVEWDFDGNGTVDGTTDLPNGTGTYDDVTTTHSYGAVVVVQPQVRAVDTSGQRSGWDKKDIVFVPIDLDTAITPPDATMQWWDPCFEILGLCSAGSPDGVPGNFTLNADYDDPDANIGGRIVEVQWDFDGNGTADQTTAVTDTSGSGSVSVVHSYAEGVYQPAVRFKDNDGQYSGWDKYDIIGIDTDLDVVDDPPSVTMEWWDPCAETLGACFAGAPDGRSNQTFTFTATGSDDVGVVTYQWDFDGNGTVDASTGTNTTTHNYGAIGAWQPQVRAVDGSGQDSGWDKLDIVFIPVDLDTAGPSADVDNPDPCFGIYPACVHGAPDANTGDVVTMNMSYDDPFGVSVASVDWDFDGNGTVDDTSSVSGTSGTASTTHQYSAGGAYTIQARAVGSDGAVGAWDDWSILGIHADYDVAAAQVRAQMSCWDPHDTIVICGAGSHDVRAGTATTLNADLDTCGALCVGNYFTPTDINDYDIEWRLGDGSPSVIESIGGGSNRSKVFAGGYGTVGAYRPEVRLCDDAATSTNCTSWDRYDVVLVEYDLDVYGPEATMQWWSPCYEVLGLCSPGSPDGSPSTTFTFTADFNDPDSGSGREVTQAQWDFNDDGVVDDTTAVSPAAGSGTATTTHTYGVELVTEPQVRFVADDGAVGAWDKYDNLLCVLDLECDLDVVITPPDAKVTFHPQNHLGGADGDTLTSFTFDASGSSDDGTIVSYEWDFNGDSVIDRTTATATTIMTYDSFGFGDGSYAATVTVTDNEGATDTEQVTDDITGLIPIHVDVGVACVGDADADGVPCRFDPDGDTSYYRHQLNYVRQSAAPGPIWTNWVPDAAITAGLNMNRTNFFGKYLYTGQFNMVNADIVLGTGATVDVQWTSLSLWADVGIGSAPDTAYLKGISFCTGKKPGSFFGVVFGFCTYQASIDDDQDLLEVEDEIYFRTPIPGYGVAEYEGFTLPLISPEVLVNVNP